MSAALEGRGCGPRTGIWDWKRDMLKTMLPAAEK